MLCVRVQPPQSEVVFAGCRTVYVNGRQFIQDEMGQATVFQTLIPG